MRFLAIALLAVAPRARATTDDPLTELNAAQPVILAEAAALQSAHASDRARLKDDIRGRLVGSTISDLELDQAFDDRRTTVIPAVVDAYRTTRVAVDYATFRAHRIDAGAISLGVKFMKDHRSELEELFRRDGVDGGLLTAVARMETGYGGGTGAMDPFSSLYTIALKVPERTEWARRELAALLLLSHRLGKNPHDLRGTFDAGLGLMQFEPSTYAAWGLPFRGSGPADLWSWPDALSSASNYLKGSGAGGADFSSTSGNARALKAYNGGDNYVGVVLELRGILCEKAGKPPSCAR